MLVGYMKKIECLNSSVNSSVGVLNVVALHEPLYK